VFSAPGRVNLIGEHTDYNDGFVLPIAIERRTAVAAAARTDRRVTARSVALSDTRSFDLDAPGPVRRGNWLDYVEGMAQALLERNFELRGAELLIDSDVPLGAGLSSSAALEMAVGLALVSLGGNADPDRIQVALAGQAAEHRYVGTMCGIMDQLTSALAEPGHALLIDCRSLAPQPVPLELGDTSVLICDSRVHHELASSEYNRRRAECREGVEILSGILPGLRSLRDVTVDELDRLCAQLPQPVRSRCRHVVRENARTLAAADALRLGNLERFGKLMFESHASLRDDYQVSSAELDVLVDTAAEIPGVLGARMTGGGFGGCTVNLVRNDALETASRRLSETYSKRFGREPNLFVTRAAGGARED
jgi:galactokinase